MGGSTSKKTTLTLFKCVCLKGPDLVLPSDDLLYLGVQDAAARPEKNQSPQHRSQVCCSSTAAFELS